MYVVVRRYAGGGGREAMAARIRRMRSGFVPLVRAQPGFRGYALFCEEDGSATTFLAFAKAAQLEAAQQAIRRWAIDSLQDLTPGPPDLLAGPVRHAALLPRAAAPEAFVSVTIFDGLPPAEEVAGLERTRLLPALAGQPGMRGAYLFRSEAAPARWISVGLFAGAEAAAAANDQVRAFMRALPQCPAPTLRRHRGGPALVLELAPAA